MSTFGFIEVGSLTYIYGRNQADYIYYSSNGGTNWTLVYNGGFAAGHSPYDVTCVNDNGTLRWFTLGSSEIYEITGTTTKTMVLSTGGQSFCSNMVDTIYVAMGSANDRAYHIDNWTSYADMGNGGSSIDWKNNMLISNIWYSNKNSFYQSFC